MKTTKSIIAVLFVLLTAQIASAYYGPSTGRWLSRDPIGEPGSQAIQAASQARLDTVSSDRWINRDSSKFSDTGNIYSFAVNNPVNYLDSDGRDTWVPYPYPGRFVPDPSPPPQLPPLISSCKNAAPETSTSVGCAVYGNETYAPFPLKPVSLKCFCQNAPDDDWSKQVRGCLMCMHAKGVPTTQAHNQCYAWASEKFHEPRLDLLATYAKCKICQHYE